MATRHHGRKHASSLRDSANADKSKKDLLNETETKMDYGIARARLSLAMLEVENKSKGSDGAVGKAMWHLSQDALALFMSLKAGVRATMNFIADLTASDDVVNDHLLSTLEENMHAFEEKYQNFTAFPDRDKVLLLLQLVEVKDQALFKICNLLTSKLGFTFKWQEEENDKSRSLAEFVNPAVQELLKLFKTFGSLAKSMRMVSYTTAEGDMTLSLYEIQQKNTEMQREMLEKDNTISTLSSRLKAVTQEVGRQQVIVAQQKEIDELALSTMSLKKEVENLKKEKKILIQSEAMTKDLLTQAQHRMKTVQEKLDKQNSSLKPQIEKTLLQYEREMRDLKSLKQELTLSDNRVNFMEQKIAESKKEVQVMENKLKAANLRNEADTMRLEVVMKENEKQKRINLVLTAAKMEAEKRTKKANMSQEQTLGKLSEKESEIVELHALMKAKDEARERIEKQLDDETLLVKAKIKEIEEFESRFLEMQKEVKMKDEYIVNLENEKKKFEIEGMTTKARKEMSIVKDNLKDLQKENAKLRSSLRKAAKEKEVNSAEDK